MTKLFPVFLCVTFGVCLQAAQPPQLPINLGSAGNFSVLAGSTVTNTGLTTIVGDVGVNPGSAVTGFPPGVVSGGAIHAGDATAGTAQGSLTAAYNDAAGRSIAAPIIGDLGGQTLTPGLYSSSTSQGLTGTLTLDALGDSTSVFIFQIGTALTTAGSSQVVLQGGAKAANIFWQVGSSATLGTNSIFKGTILALTSITLTTGATLDGRALARNGAVTLDTNTIGNAGPPLTLTVTCPAATGQVDLPYNSSASATGGTAPYTFTFTGTPPSGLTPAATGALSGTPDQVGTYSFVVNAADSASAIGSKRCTIVISGSGPPPTPIPTSIILVLVGLAGMVLYSSRGGLRRIVRGD